MLKAGDSTDDHHSETAPTPREPLTNTFGTLPVGQMQFDNREALLVERMEVVRRGMRRVAQSRTNAPPDCTSNPLSSIYLALIEGCFLASESGFRISFVTNSN